MRRYLLVFKLFFLFNCVFAQSDWNSGSEIDYRITRNLEFYSQNNLWGIQTRRNKPITPALYDTLIEISDNHILARRWIKAKQQLLWGTLNTEGKQLIPFEYSKLEPHKQVFICGEQKNNLVSYGLMSADGKIIVNAIYNRIDWVSDNRFAALKGDRTTVIDALGNKIIQISADSVKAIADRLLQIWSGGKTGLISTEGDRLTETKYANMNHENNKILASSYPEWFVVNQRDTSYFAYSQLKSWNGQYIVTGNEHQWLISPKDSALSDGYDLIQADNEHIAIVSSNNQYGAINNNGKEILQANYDSLIYENGYFLARKGLMKPSWSLIDTFGVIKTHFNYETIRNPGENLFAIKRKDKWGFINRYGVEIIPAIYDKVSDFSSGLARVTYFDEQGIIDNQGNWVIKPRNEQIQWLGIDRYLGNSYGLSFIKNFNGEYIYFTSNRLIKSKNLIHELDSSGQIIQRLTLNGTFVYRTEEFVPQYGESEGFAMIKKNNKFGFVDVQGRLRVAYRYDSLRPFSEGLSAVKLNGHWGFINKLESIIVQPQYDAVGDFKDGHAVIYRDGHSGIITKSGAEIIKPIYDKIQPTAFGYYIVQSGNKMGILNHIGAAILHPRYEYLQVIDNEVIIIKRRNLYGIVDLNGVSVVPMEYSFIEYDKKSRSFFYKQPASAAKLVYQFSAL